MIGSVIFTGCQYVKITEVKPFNHLGDNKQYFIGHLWVKSRKDWTKKVSMFGPDRYEVLNDREIEMLKE